MARGRLSLLLLLCGILAAHSFQLGLLTRNPCIAVNRCLPPASNARPPATRAGARRHPAAGARMALGDRPVRRDRDIHQFVTQRALQSLLGLMHMNRDQITADWLAEWNGHEGIERYHGLNGLQMDWSDYINTLLRAPGETLVVEFKRRGNSGHGGWSGNNPYLKNHVMEMKTEINPRQLAERLMAVREELGREWIEMLPLLQKENDEVWRSWFEKVRSDDGLTDVQANMQLPQLESFDPTNLQGSLFQGGDYDLIKTLATLCATDRVRRRMQGESGGKPQAEFLERMLNVHGIEFEGDMQLGASQRFIEEVLKQSPSVIGGTGYSQTTILDPVGITESILEERVKVASEWADELQSVPADHADMMRALLTEQY